MFVDHVHDQLGKHRVGIINETMPFFIKMAEEKVVTEDLTKLANGCFAYSDGVNNYFPIHTPEHTWMSHAYFEKFAHTIDEKSAIEIRERINDAYQAFQLPERSLVKVAAKEDEIDALHSLSIELNKFINNYKKLPPAERRVRAKELASHAKALNREGSLHDTVRRYTGDNLRKDHSQAFANRMRYFHFGAPERSMLLKMQDEAPSHVPELVAKALSIFDNTSGLCRHYDNDLEDPYVGLLDSHEDPEEHLDIDGYRVHPNHLRKFDWDSLSDVLDHTFLGKLKSSPLEAIRGADPHVRVIIVKRITHA